MSWSRRPGAAIGEIAANLLRHAHADMFDDLLGAAADAARRDHVRDSLKSVEIELRIGKQLGARLMTQHDELTHRVARMRQKFAREYGMIIPEVRISDELSLHSKSYDILIHGARVAGHELRPGEVLVVIGESQRPDYPCEETREPAFGMKGVWVPETFADDLRRDGYTPIDLLSILLTHLSEVIRGNLAQLLPYTDMKALINRLDPDYKRLVEEIAPAHLSMSGLQAVLKLLVAERVSIRNLHLVLEAIAEFAPHARRPEQIVEHVRMRMAQQICGDLTDGGALKVLRLGAKWDNAFHQGLKRDAKGEVAAFDIDPRMIEQFSAEAAASIRALMDEGHRFVLLAAAEARPYVRMVVERLFPTLSVLSHLEIARGADIKPIGSIA
jgi:flagellar biosynthesis protein FlhA